jgi:hypothetical protein
LLATVRFALVDAKQFPCVAFGFLGCQHCVALRIRDSALSMPADGHIVFVERGDTIMGKRIVFSVIVAAILSPAVVAGPIPPNIRRAAPQSAT